MAPHDARLVTYLPDPVRGRLRTYRYHATYTMLRLDHAAQAATTAARAQHRVLFHPQLPSPHNLAYKVCAALGYRITDDPNRRCDLVMRWDRKTFSDPASDRVLEGLARTQRVINLGCTDISKDRVNEAFAKAFGYDLGVDPRIHSGLAVEKSNLNARHDGRTVVCPLPALAPDCTYQRLVDNRVVDDDDSVMDMRVPVFDGYLPLVYLRYRPVERRFRSGNRSVRIARVQDVLDRSEIAALLRMCEILGMEYGELDVLRDRDDGRVYAVDANNTPFGPPSSITARDGQRALRLLAAAFQSELVDSDRTVEYRRDRIAPVVR